MQECEFKCFVDFDHHISLEALVGMLKLEEETLELLANLLLTMASLHPLQTLTNSSQDSALLDFPPRTWSPCPVQNIYHIFFQLIITFQSYSKIS